MQEKYNSTPFVFSPRSIGLLHYEDFVNVTLIGGGREISLRCQRDKRFQPEADRYARGALVSHRSK